MLIEGNLEEVKCAICGKKAKILTTHILKQHKISMEEYKKKYNDDYIVAPAVRKKIAKNAKSVYSIKYYLDKGYTEEKAKKKVEEFTIKNCKKSRKYWHARGYSEEEINDILKKEVGHSLEKFINKYGKEEGTKRYNEWRQKLSEHNKKENLIKVYGEDFLKNRKINEEFFINKYGKELGKKKWIERLNKLKKSQEEYLNRIKKEFINIYGEHKYKKYYELFLKDKHGVSLEKFIQKYGEKEGTRKYYEWKENSKNTLNIFIKKYGEKEGTKRYKEYIRNKRIPFSKEATLLFQEIENFIKKYFDKNYKLYYGQNEYIIYMDEVKYKINKQFMKIDFTLKEKKKNKYLFIEYLGEYYHRNLQEKDKLRERNLQNYKGLNNYVLMINAKYFKKNKQKILKQIYKKIWKYFNIV